MAEQPGNSSNQQRRPGLLKMDLPTPPSNISFAFRPLPNQINSVEGNSTSRPKMTLPKIPRATVDPMNDKTR